jgi:hypothetical protein
VRPPRLPDLGDRERYSRRCRSAGLVAMNLSLGSSSESQAEKDAIAYATSKTCSSLRRPGTTVQAA